MSLKILDTGAFRKDPYVIVDETGAVLAQSYSEDEKHYKHGLDEILSRIAALEAALAEAREVVKPFAEYSNKGSFKNHDESVLIDAWCPYPEIVAITYGDIRRAAEWLKKQEASA